MIQAYFSNIRNIILNEIHNSKRDISIAVAWFTQRDLFNAIIGAIDRGVNVSLILINDIINRNEYGLDFSLYLQLILIWIYYLFLYILLLFYIIQDE